jgi:trans-aconitate methyltransferase
MGWNPEEYVLGSYFQGVINESFRKRFSIEPSGAILDIGCGDGQYTRFLADNYQQGQFLGIDSSAAMIKHANQYWTSSNLSFSHSSIEEFKCQPTFDFALSFWCLHWTAIEVSLTNIFHALKSGGVLYAVFSSFLENSITQVFRELVKQERYRELIEPRIRSAQSVKEKYFYRVVNSLNQLPFKNVKLNLTMTRVALPTVDYFKHLLLTMPFMKTFPEDISDDLIKEMSLIFQTICQSKHRGTLYYESRPIFLEAVK